MYKAKSKKKNRWVSPPPRGKKTITYLHHHNAQPHQHSQHPTEGAHGRARRHTQYTPQTQLPYYIRRRRALALAVIIMLARLREVLLRYGVERGGGFAEEGTASLEMEMDGRGCETETETKTEGEMGTEGMEEEHCSFFERERERLFGDGKGGGRRISVAGGCAVD